MTLNARRAWAGAALVAAIVVWPAVILAEDSLSTARDLYAAAAYEDALAALDRLRAGGVRVDEGRAVDQYRAFCLLALGKSSEAARAIEAVVSADPSYHPADSDVSPRVRAAFSDVRRRLLPDLAQQKYQQAKASFDRKDYRLAAESFGQLLDLFADPDLAVAVAKPPLTDLRMLALGFRVRRPWRRPLLPLSRCSPPLQPRPWRRRLPFQWHRRRRESMRPPTPTSCRRRLSGRNCRLTVAASSGRCRASWRSWWTRTAGSYRRRSGRR
jgi:tetratricopeptide (TPR) repeat protein